MEFYPVLPADAIPAGCDADGGPTGVVAIRPTDLRRPGRGVSALLADTDAVRGRGPGVLPSGGGRVGRGAACRGASCGPAAMSALLVEVVVYAGTVHADGLGDLGHGVLPPAVRAGGLVHAADRGGLPGV